MKKVVWLSILAVLALVFGSIGAAQAEIIPPQGEGQIGIVAIVLYDGLETRQEPNADSKVVETLTYGQHIILTKQMDEWAECVLSDSVDAGPAGWVETSCLIIDPAWYMTDGKTPVYEWNSTEAPVVAEMDEYTLLPVLHNEGEWIVVPAGWIHLENVSGKTFTDRLDGEIFTDVIIIEGMEETVNCEHVKNDTLGLEIDYDYERFERRSTSDRECFVSLYDDAQSPENYLELTYRAEDIDTVTASVNKELLKDYDTVIEQFSLDCAGDCIRIDASEAAGGKGTPNLMQMVYIIPADNGCIVATAHYGFESAEGFGARFNHMMNTFALIDSTAE